MGKKFTRQWVLFLAFVSLNARSILFLFFLDVSANWRFSICIYLGQSSYVFLFYFASFLFYLICLQGRGAHTIENIPHAKDLWLSLPVRMDSSLFHCSLSWCIDWIESRSWNQQIQVFLAVKAYTARAGETDAESIWRCQRIDFCEFHLLFCHFSHWIIDIENLGG